jgi:hypothetical protein
MSDVDRVEVAVKQIRQVPEGFSLEEAIMHLNVGQQAALEALIATGKKKDAAEAAAVHRNTITQWLKTDPFFKAAYNASLEEAHESVRATLRSVAERAAKNIEEAVEEGDRNLSYRLLKDLGHLGKQPDISTDPKVIQTQMENEARRQAGGEEGANVISVVQLLLRARQAEKRRRREQLTTGKPQPQLP